jgi:L-arabinose isomerase
MAAGTTSGARVGLMAVGLGSYWPQFPEMRDTILEAHRRLAGLISPYASLVEAGLVDSVESSRGAGAKFRTGDVDLVFVHLATYANSETLLPAIRALDVPVILLNVQPVRALDMARTTNIGDWLGSGVTPSSLPEMTNVLIRLGKRFDTVTGHLDGDAELAAELELWCRIAGLTRRLRTQSIALLGRPFAGMMDLNLDETHIFNRFGTFIRHLDWDDVVAEMEAVTAEERARGVEELRKTFPSSGTLSVGEFEAAGAVMAAMRRFVSRYNLCAIASHYEAASSGRRAELLAALNPALSVLNGSGIACPVEADVKVAFAMLTLKTLGGSATLAELYSMDFDDDIIIIGHSGAGDPAISGEQPRLALSEVFHGKSGKGYLTQFYPRHGDTTLLSLTQDVHGDYRMVAAEGEIVPGPTLQLGDTNARVRFPQGIRRFTRDWSAFGPTHHGVMGCGHHANNLSRVANALGVPLDIVRPR